MERVLQIATAGIGGAAVPRAAPRAGAKAEARRIAASEVETAIPAGPLGAARPRHKLAPSVKGLKERRARATDT